MNLIEPIENALKSIVESLKKENLISPDKEYAFKMDIPRNHQHGDYATNLPFILSKEFKQPPAKVAEIVKSRFDFTLAPFVGKIEIAPSGYINFFLGETYLEDIVRRIESEDEHFGYSVHPHPQKIQVEFVSANPTGPLNIVSARAASVGDGLANILNRAGHEVTREFYVNDFGVQARLFAESLRARYLELLGFPLELPEKGYMGEYLIDLAKSFQDEKVFAQYPDPHDIPLDEIKQVGLDRMITEQHAALDLFGVAFDMWFRESWLHRDGKPMQTLARLKELGHTYEKDNATWFRSTAFGDNDDRVLVKSDGHTSYYLNDITYHVDKFNRGFDRVIDIWGPDHHGHIIRMKAAMKALGYKDEQFEILIVQQVNLLRNGEKVKMSKRAGQIESMADLITEVGVDAARFFFLMRGHDSHMDFDLEVAKYQTNDNPVFYVQYAHARVCNIFNQATQKGFTIPASGEVDLSLLKTDEEAEIIKMLANYPQSVRESAEAYEPHRMVRYLMDLATRLHHYYNQHRVISEDIELSKARLVLLKVVRIVLRNGLTAIGVSKPERM